MMSRLVQQCSMGLRRLLDDTYKCKRHPSGDNGSVYNQAAIN